VGSRGEDPIGGLVDEPPQADTYFGNGCKTGSIVLSTVTNPMGSLYTIRGHNLIVLGAGRLSS